MSLYTIKPWFVRRLRRLEDALVARRVSPNSLTAVAIAASAAAGATVALGGILGMPGMWLAVPPLVLVRLGLNALDGSIARRTHTASRWGTALNEIGDRASDILTVGATAFVVPPELAVTAVAGGLAASSAGVLSQALTGVRDCGGPFGKADRAALLAAGALVGAVTGSSTPFVVAVVAIATGAIVTAAVRLRRLKHAVMLPAPAGLPGFIEIPTDEVLRDAV